MPEITQTAGMSHAELHTLLDAFLTDITAVRAPLAGMLSAEETWDAGSIASGAETANDFTVTGAALGDFVLVALEVDVTDLVVDAQVTAADTVTVVLANNTGGAVDLASTTVNIRVLPEASFDAPAALTVTT